VPSGCSFKPKGVCRWDKTLIHELTKATHSEAYCIQMPVTATFFSNHQTFEPAKKKTIVCSAYQRVFLALSFSRSMLRFASPNNFHQAKQCYFQIFNIHIPNDIFPPKICHHHDPSVLARVHSKITKSSLVSHVGSTKIRTNANLTSILDHYSAKVPKGGAPFVTQPIVDGLHSKLRRRHFTTHLFLVPIFFWSVNPDWANNF
jgi:hypothetical protein